MKYCICCAFLCAALVSAPGCLWNGPDDSDKPADLVHPALYSADSPFNRKIPPDAAVDPRSDQMLESILDQVDSHGFFIAVREWTSPVFFADATTPRHAVSLTVSWAPYRVMQNVPIPDFAEPDPQGDGTMVIVDLDSGCEYDLWQARRGALGRWSASWGNSLKTDGDGVYPKGLSARGSGFAFLGGMIWPDELQAGKIEHALAFSYDHTKAGGPVPPATESDGTSVRADAIPEGALVQLDPALDLDTLGLTGYEKTIARALQEYGMYLVDDGGGVQLQAVSPLSVQGDPYEGILPDEDYVSLANIPVEHFRILLLAPQVSDPELEVVPSGCADMGP